MSTITTNWFHETHKDHHSLGMSQKEVLYHQRSDYQDVLVFENELYGTVLVLDGCYMLSDLDEHMYHKALTNYGMQNVIASDSEAIQVLVIGAGDGGIVRDLLRNWGEQIDKVRWLKLIKL